VLLLSGAEIEEDAAMTGGGTGGRSLNSIAMSKPPGVCDRAEVLSCGSVVLGWRLSCCAGRVLHREVRRRDFACEE